MKKNIYIVKEQFSLIWLLDRHRYISIIIISSVFGFNYLIFPNKISLFFYKKNLFIFNLSLKKNFLSLTNLIISNFISFFFSFYNLYIIELNLIGIGFKVYLNKYYLNFELGFSHIIKLKLPQCIKFYSFNKGLCLVLQGINKKNLKGIASFIRSLKIPDNYKGKGIRYVYEILKLKEK